MSRDPSRRDDAQRVVDGLTDLFDAVPPADRTAAEEELRESGVDPTAVGRRLAARAAALSPGRPQRAGVVRELEPRAPHRAEPRIGMRLLRIAAVLVLGVGIGWWAFRSSPTPEQIVQRVPAPGRAPTLPQRASADATPGGSQPAAGSAPTAIGGGDQPALAAAPVSGAAGRDALAAPYDPGPAYDAYDDELVGALGDSWILDADSWQRAGELLPAPVLAQVQRGNARFRVIAIGDQPARRSVWAGFRPPSGWNADIYDLAADNCGLLNRRTKRPPTFYFGLLFPQIERDAPQAGCQIMWNVEAAGAVAGGRLTLEDVDAAGIGAGRARIETEALAFLGRHLGPIDNPAALRSASLRRVTGGGSVLAQLTRRPIGVEPDGNWVYVPSLRRVRRLTNSAAADPALGSGVSRDDRECFDGRLETFDWQVIDETTALVPLIAARPLQQRALPPTRAQVDLPNLQPPSEGGDGGAGSGGKIGDLPLTERPVWVVEGTSRDPQAEAARIVLYVDRELYRPYWKIAYRRNGELADHLLCAQYWSASEGQHLTTPGTGLLARIDPSGAAVVARRRREVLEQDLRDDWFSVRSMIESAGGGARD